MVGLINNASEQWFSISSTHTNHLEGLLMHRLLDPRASGFLIQSISGKAWKSAFLISSLCPDPAGKHTKNTVVELSTLASKVWRFSFLDLMYLPKFAISENRCLFPQYSIIHLLFFWIAKKKKRQIFQIPLKSRHYQDSRLTGWINHVKSRKSSYTVSLMSVKALPNGQWSDEKCQPFLSAGGWAQPMSIMVGYTTLLCHTDTKIS